MLAFTALYDLVAWLDDQLAEPLSYGSVWVVVPIALALGLRHATDPDHLVAVSALVGAEQPSTRRAMRLGAWWGAGHALTLVVLGIPLIALDATPPSWLTAGAEKAIAAIIIALSIRALVHSHRPTPRPARTPWGAASVGVVHGLGGTGAIVLLFVASIGSPGLAATALLVFAPMSVVSMALCSGGVGWALSRPGVAARTTAVTWAFALVGVSFGLWYALLAG